MLQARAKGQVCRWLSFGCRGNKAEGVEESQRAGGGAFSCFCRSMGSLALSCRFIDPPRQSLLRAKREELSDCVGESTCRYRPKVRFSLLLFWHAQSATDRRSSTKTAKTSQEKLMLLRRNKKTVHQPTPELAVFDCVLFNTSPPAAGVLDALLSSGLSQRAYMLLCIPLPC